MSEHINNTLINLGMNEVEAKIYFELLRSSKQSITHISRATNIKRPTCYIYIDELLKKNFIIRVPVGNKFHYSAIDPEKLVNSFRENLKKAEESLNEMKAMYNKTLTETKVSFFEGKTGISNVYKDSFKTVGEAYSIFPADEFFKQYSFDEFVENEMIISDTKFKSKDIIISEKNYSKIDNFLKIQNNKSKIYKRFSGDLNTSVDVLIYGNKVALITLKNLSAIVIDNSEIAELFKSIHAYLWKNPK